MLFDIGLLRSVSAVLLPNDSLARMQFFERCKAVISSWINFSEPGSDPFYAFEDSGKVFVGTVLFEEVEVYGWNVSWVWGLEFDDTSLRARVHVYEGAFVLVGAVSLVEVRWDVGKTEYFLSATFVYAANFLKMEGKGRIPLTRARNLRKRMIHTTYRCP